MQKSVAVLLVALFMLVASSDRIVCPDGCTDDAQNHSASAPASSVGECMLCQHAVSPAVSISVVSPGELIPRRYQSPDVRLIVAPVIGIEHPPRAA